MFGGGLKQVAGRLLETPALDSLTFALAESENELLRAAEALDAAHGNENVTNIPAVEHRQAALKELLRALITDSFDAVWLEEIAPEILDEPERAEQYMAMGAGEWTAQKERWAAFYREQGASGSDEQLAAYHVRETFGVEMDVFEDRIVHWNAGDEAEHLFAGNFRACVDAMRESAAAAGEGDE